MSFKTIIGTACCICLTFLAIWETNVLPSFVDYKPIHIPTYGARMGQTTTANPFNTSENVETNGNLSFNQQTVGMYSVQSTLNTTTSQQSYGGGSALTLTSDKHLKNIGGGGSEADANANAHRQTPALAYTSGIAGVSARRTSRKESLRTDDIQQPFSEDDIDMMSAAGVQGIKVPGDGHGYIGDLAPIGDAFWVMPLLALIYALFRRRKRVLALVSTL